MIQVEPISLKDVWQPDQDLIQSFKGRYRAGRVRGPARLVRLLSHAGQAPEGQMYSSNLLDGSYWFAESDFLRIRNIAEADLKQQASRTKFQASLQTLTGVYLRHQLRFLLAVRRDWTPSFDYYATLVIPVGGSVIAYVGTIREQPVYSKEFAGEAAARQAGIKLDGGLTQYAIWFDFAANKPARQWIGAPVGLAS